MEVIWYHSLFLKGSAVVLMACAGAIAAHISTLLWSHMYIFNGNHTFHTWLSGHQGLSWTGPVDVNADLVKRGIDNSYRCCLRIIGEYSPGQRQKPIRVQLIAIICKSYLQIISNVG